MRISGFSTRIYVDLWFDGDADLRESLGFNGTRIYADHFCQRSWFEEHCVLVCVWTVYE